MKTKYKPAYLILFLFCLSAISCKDIIEKDISNTEIKINTPQDNFVATNYQVTFWWNEVNDIQKYRLQIASPSFDSLKSFILDTLTPNIKLVLTLYPGKYQWRIRGENGSSYTKYYTRNLTIDTSTNISNQTFTTISPQNNFASNSSFISFSWLSTPYATQYEYYLLDTLNVVKKVKFSTGVIMSDTIQEGHYYWKVRATNINTGTSTLFSNPKKLIVDLTSPSPSVPNSPVYNDSLINNITLKWIRPNDVVTDSIYLSTDSTFKTSTVSYRSTSTSLVLSPLNTGTMYYWRIKSFDIAQNTSEYSSLFRFYVNP